MYPGVYIFYKPLGLSNTLLHLCAIATGFQLYDIQRLYSACIYLCTIIIFFTGYYLWTMFGFNKSHAGISCIDWAFKLRHTCQLIHCMYEW